MVSSKLYPGAPDDASSPKKEPLVPSGPGEWTVEPIWTQFGCDFVSFVRLTMKTG